MPHREINRIAMPAIGLGCMNLSHAYGTPPDEAESVRLLHRAVELGIRHFDTAALYGFGQNESLVGKALRAYRPELFLASKCGMTGVDGKRVLDGRPATLMRTIDESLRRLQTDYIDLYYLHRWDSAVPIEDSVGALSRMVEQGKIGAVGLSEVSAVTLRKAHAVHPVAALQSEYSLWTRNAEIAVLDACHEIGAALVAFSPVARGWLANPALDPESFVEKDLRRTMPRFKPEHFQRNRALQQNFLALANEAACSSAQLALSWLLSRGRHVLPIPGTTSTAHLEENLAALDLKLEPALLIRAGELINQHTVSGRRYPDEAQADIDTEEF